MRRHLPPSANQAGNNHMKATAEANAACMLFSSCPDLSNRTADIFDEDNKVSRLINNLLANIKVSPDIERANIPAVLCKCGDQVNEGADDTSPADIGSVSPMVKTPNPAPCWLPSGRKTRAVDREHRRELKRGLQHAANYQPRWPPE